MPAITIPNTFLPSTTISSTAMNQNFSEVADGIEASLALDGTDTMTGVLRLANGSAAAPALTFGSDLNLGIFRKTTDELGFTTAGVLAAHIDAAGKMWLATDLDIADDVDIGGDLIVDGASTFTGTATFSGSIVGIPAASDGTAGLIDTATTAEIYAAASGAHALTAEDLETASASVALTDAATVAVNWDAGINFTLTVTANRAIGNPTNGQPGTMRNIYVIGNSTTDRTITFGNQFLGDVPTITDVDNGRAYLISIFCVTASHFVASAKRALGT